MPLDPKKFKIKDGKLTINVTEQKDGNLNLGFSQSLTAEEQAEILCMLSIAAVQTLDAIAITVVLYKDGQAQVRNAENLPLGMLADALQRVADELKRKAKEAGDEG